MRQARPSVGFLCALVALSTACASDDDVDSESHFIQDGGGTLRTDGFPLAPEPEPLAWAPCTEPELVGLECATLRVPMDYEHPEGEAIQIAVSRMRASDADRRLGVLLFNPGGPGYPGRLVPDRQGLDGFRARFDVIGFDPRGIGASSAVDCGELSAAYIDADRAPDDDAEQQLLESTMRDFARACEGNTGPLLEFVDSYSAARDMDQIRRALGEDRISFWGTSYGTVLGTAYADLFPDRLRAVVLEGAIAPNLDGAAYFTQMAVAREQAFEVFAADCDARPECTARFAGFGGDIRAALDHAVELAGATPFVDPDTGKKINETQLAMVVGEYLSRLPGQAPTLEELVETAAAGRPGMAASFDLTAFGPAIAILCADKGLPDPNETYGELLPELRRIGPRVGHTSVAFTLPCAHWSTEPRVHPAPHAEGAPPILVIGGTGDPIGGIESARELANELESGVLLTRDGPGIDAFSQCVADAIGAYLVDLALPPEGTVCPTP